MGEVFRIKEIKYDLRTDLSLVSKNIRTVHYGLESISYLGPRIWKLVPNNIKESTSLGSFKMAIKRWVPDGCPCRLCKSYVQNVGFI